MLSTEIKILKSAKYLHITQPAALYQVPAEILVCGRTMFEIVFL